MKGISDWLMVNMYKLIDNLSCLMTLPNSNKIWLVPGGILTDSYKFLYHNVFYKMLTSLCQKYDLDFCDCKLVHCFRPGNVVHYMCYEGYACVRLCSSSIGNGFNSRDVQIFFQMKVVGWLWFISKLGCSGDQLEISWHLFHYSNIITLSKADMALSRVDMK